MSKVKNNHFDEIVQLELQFYFSYEVGPFSPWHGMSSGCRLNLALYFFIWSFLMS